MRINRVALMRACEEAETRNHQAWSTRMAKIRERDDQALKEWRDAYEQEWQAAALKIRRVLRGGGAVTDGMLPSSRYRNIAIFHPDRDLDRPYQPLKEIAALRTVLSSISDDVVTLSGLERLGLSRGTIREAVQHLAAATIEGTDS
jgi:hypothetical protein